MSRRRGSVLVSALLLMSVIFVLGVGFLAKRVEQYRAAVQSAYAAQARALAWSGLEQARVKLDKDAAFPPPGADDQQVFGFSEEVTDAGGNVVGSFTVEVDSRYAIEPYYLLIVTSTGQLASRDNTGEALARRTLRAELDFAPDLVSGVRGRAEPVVYSNPRYFEFLTLTDLGGY